MAYLLCQAVCSQPQCNVQRHISPTISAIASEMTSVLRDKVFAAILMVGYLEKCLYYLGLQP